MLIRQILVEKPHPIVAEDAADGGILEARTGQRIGQFRQIGGRDDFGGDLVAPEPTVHVGSEADVFRVAGQITEMPDVPHDILQRGPSQAIFGGGDEEFVEEIDADHTATLEEGAGHVIAELPVGRHDRTTVRVRGDDRPFGEVQQLPEGFLGQMRHIVDDSEAFQFVHHRDSGGGERPGLAGATGEPGAFPGETDDTEPRRKPLRDIGGRAQGVGTLHQKNRVRGLGRRRHIRQFLRAMNQPHRSVGVLPLIPMQLNQRRRTGLLRVRIPRLTVDRRCREDRRADQPNPARNQIRQPDSGNLPLCHRLPQCRQRDIPATGDVVSQIEMGIDDEHRVFPEQGFPTSLDGDPGRIRSTPLPEKPFGLAEPHQRARRKF